MGERESGVASWALEEGVEELTAPPIVDPSATEPLIPSRPRNHPTTPAMSLDPRFSIAALLVVLDSETDEVGG